MRTAATDAWLGILECVLLCGRITVADIASLRICKLSFTGM